MTVPCLLEKAARKIAPLLGLLSDSLGEQDFLLGDFSLVDLAYAPWLPWLDLDEHPSLLAWRDRLVSREVWRRCGVVQPEQDG